MKQSARPLIMRLAATAAIISLSIQTANADWITDKLQDTCAGTDFMSKQAQDVRNQVDSFVNRSETAIQPPSPVGDLSCLNDLMSSIDLTSIFSGAMGGMGGLMNKLGVSGLSAATGPGGIEGMICQFAQQKWQELTGKLQQAFQGGGSGGSGGSSLGAPDYMENFGSANFPPIATGSSGSGNEGDGTGIPGSETNTGNGMGNTTPITGPNTPGILNNGQNPMTDNPWTNGQTPGAVLNPYRNNKNHR